jgi:carbon-monoxide dehydrogenase small subunit
METASVSSGLTLLEFLRERLYLTGTKEGCGIGECGACTVLLDRKPVTACLVLAVEADGCTVETVEGEATDGQLSVLQRAFVETGAIQCGFCTPGMIMSARGLLRRNSNPSDDQIVEAMAGNLCRCTGYEAILAAVRLAAVAVVAQPKAEPLTRETGSEDSRFLRGAEPLTGEAVGSQPAAETLTGETDTERRRFLRGAESTRKGGRR